MARIRKQRPAILDSPEPSSGSNNELASAFQTLELGTAPSSFATSLATGSDVPLEQREPRTQKKARRRNAANSDKVEGLYWCWTWFGYEEVPEEQWPRREQWSLISYLVWQREKCPTTGRMHLQGYVELEKKRTFSTVKAHLPYGAHIERRKKTALEASNYCKKPEGRPYGEPYESGTLSVPEQGARTDLEAFKEAVKRGLSKDEAIEEHSEIIAKYPRFVDVYYHLQAKKACTKILEYTPIYGWQQEVLDIIKTSPDPRAIHWVYDEYGNSGKSYLTKHLLHAHGAFAVSGGKAVDIAHNYEYQRIVIFDFPRCASDHISWGAIEEIKNGVFTSNKYNSMTKIFDSPHVFVFANWPAPDGKFSRDRIRTIELGPDHEKVTNSLFS